MKIEVHADAESVALQNLMHSMGMLAESRKLKRQNES